MCKYMERRRKGRGEGCFAAQFQEVPFTFIPYKGCSPEVWNMAILSVPHCEAQGRGDWDM